MTHCTENCPRDVVANPVGMTAAILQLLRQSLQARRLKTSIQRERAHLLTMSTAQLRDIGVDRSDANAEANRSDIPGIRIR